MPTGYTSDLYEGKPITFPEFAMRCARAMGALIMMRDEPSDAAIPEEFEAHSYSRDRLEEAQGRLLELKAMVPQDAAQRATTEHQKEVEECSRRLAEKKAVRSRYTGMIDQVQAWTPPTSEHEGLKKFMLEQLENSIDFDCGPLSPPGPILSGEEWLAKQTEKARWDLDYHTDAWEKEQERAKGRTEWVRQLRDSLR